ncbi:CsbD family protein [Verticiella sediminum]|uniref:CsbD family protein n=1 Tax=Verticiella sediminum TaxID=1247510 RepID=A0A556AU89_9BURK|nr:CsbD family protein [Verticiella sediminum]TSH96514.1 CsbD family protein [Verticiella sediminum]
MNSDQFEGKADRVVGRAQEAAGVLTGNDRMRGEGAARQLSGAAQDLYGQACDQLKGVAAEVADRVERNPIGALLAAGFVGYVLGVLSRR